jgi:class 3 adenylate cyclase
LIGYDRDDHLSEPMGADVAADAVSRAVAGDRRRPGAPVRLVVWALHLALPLFGLWLLIAQPGADKRWEHHPSHFWLVFSVAAVNVALALVISEAARRRSDARLFLVSLAFGVSAGFLLLHALATPGVVLDDPNRGFAVATPVGLLLAAVFALLSSVDYSPERSAALVARAGLIRGVLLAVIVAWGIASIAGLPPLSDAPGPREVSGPLALLAGFAVAVYGLAALRYFQLHRRRPAVMLLGILTAWALLAEAMIAVVYARNWQVSWWLWHLLMAAGFGFVAYSAYVQYQREGSPRGLFNSIALEATVQQLRHEYGAALEALVETMGRQEAGQASAGTDLVAAGLAARFGLSEGQTAVLGRAAEALAADRDQIRRLDGLVAVGRRASVVGGEDELLAGAVEALRPALGPDALRIGLLGDDGELRYPPKLSSAPDGTWAGGEERDAALRLLLTGPDGPVTAGPGLVLFPLTVKGQAAGVVEFRHAATRLDERDRSVLESLASQLSIALENSRLYRQIDVLFHQYLSPDVATALLADPAQAALGGAEFEVTVLFADLRGFTGFSEYSTPEQVVDMLNRYFGAATPCVLDEGGTVVQFIGDALMALFNSPVRQPDHAARAARAALAMQRSVEAIQAGRPGWPRFRIGVNTGPALVGNVGSEQFRSWNVMGDAVNVAARLEAVAEPGQVLVGERTWRAIAGAEGLPLGPLRLKGRSEPVRAWVLTGLGVRDAPAGKPQPGPTGDRNGDRMSEQAGEQVGDDPDGQPNSEAGAASEQAFEAATKSKAEGDDEETS